MTLAEINAQLADLETKKKVLEKEAEAAREAKRKAVKQQRRFTFKPLDRHDKVWDPSCRWWYLNCEVLNKEELEAAGVSEWNIPHNKGMSYLFNGASGKLVCSFGGGNVFIVDGYWSASLGKDKQAEAEADAKEVVEKLGLFCRQYPTGGDVTDIIESQRRP